MVTTANAFSLDASASRPRRTRAGRRRDLVRRAKYRVAGPDPGRSVTRTDTPGTRASHGRGRPAAGLRHRRRPVMGRLGPSRAAANKKARAEARARPRKASLRTLCSAEPALQGGTGTRTLRSLIVLLTLAVAGLRHGLAARGAGDGEQGSRRAEALELFLPELRGRGPVLLLHPGDELHVRTRLIERRLAALAGGVVEIKGFLEDEEVRAAVQQGVMDLGVGGEPAGLLLLQRLAPGGPREWWLPCPGALTRWTCSSADVSAYPNVPQPSRLSANG